MKIRILLLCSSFFLIFSFSSPLFSHFLCHDYLIVCCLAGEEVLGDIGEHRSCLTWTRPFCSVCNEDQEAFDRQCHEKSYKHSKDTMAMISVSCHIPDPPVKKHD